MPDQLEDIYNMTKSVKRPGIHESINLDILSGKYNTCPDGYAKCNLFTNDALTNYFGIDLPRRREFKTPSLSKRTSEGEFEGWEDAPASASAQELFFNSASKLPGSGVSLVDPMTGSKLAKEGNPVIVLGRGHATIAAPHDKWPEIYRSDLSYRKDKRTTVGLKDSDAFKFYALDKDKYKRFRSIMKDFKAEDIIYDFESGSAKIRELLSK